MTVEFFKNFHQNSRAKVRLSNNISIIIFEQCCSHLLLLLEKSYQKIRLFRSKMQNLPNIVVNPSENDHGIFIEFFKIFSNPFYLYCSCHLSTCKSWWIMMSCTKKGDKITSFVNHCYIIREQRARKNHKERKKNWRMHSILEILYIFWRKICDEKCCQMKWKKNHL